MSGRSCSLLWLVWLGACVRPGDSTTPGGPAEPTAVGSGATEPEAHAADAGEADAGEAEAGEADAGEADAGETPTPTPEPGEVWRFTTLVTGGPETMIGANGYYELVLDGDRISVQKIGQRGTPRFPEERVMKGASTVELRPDPSWPEATSGSVLVTLTNGAATHGLALDLFFLGDELHGAWIQPHERPDQATQGRLWGLLRGTKGHGEPLPLVDGEGAPCVYCNRAFHVCSGMGEGGCNSSNMAIDECNARLRRAKKRAEPEIPRGCGDWLHEE